MNVSKGKVYNVLKTQENDLTTENWSWELSFVMPDRNWVYKDVEDLQEKLALYEDFEFYREDDILKIYTTDDNLLLEIEGLPNIIQYCDTESFENIVHEWYYFAEISHKNINNHYNLDFNSTVIHRNKSNINEKKIDWENMGKYFHQTRSIGYIHKETGIIYVCQIARISNDAFQTMKDANLSSQRIQIDIKIVMNNKYKGKDKTKELIKHMMFLYTEITEEAFPLMKQDQDVIMKKYMKLISEVREISNYEKKNPSYYYLAPKPVTLERKNIIDPENVSSLGIPSILKNYAVTDKADGERMLLYLDDEGQAFLINGIYQVNKLGIQVSKKFKKFYNSLLDGEYISTRLLKDNSTSIFKIFDIYFSGGKNVMNLPLFDKTKGKNSRYKEIELISDVKIWGNSNILIEMKKHIPANDKLMFKACENILNDKTRPYKIDGLVFTPIDLPVFGYYPNEFHKIKGKSVKWDKVFKWKPPDQNTIDFLVKNDEDNLYVDNKSNTSYKRFLLNTGYDNSAAMEEISIYDGVSRIYNINNANNVKINKNEKPENTYVARVFKPINNYREGVSTAFIPINSIGQGISEEGEVIENDTIVEMAYMPDDNKHPSLCWVAKRVREDKTKAYRTTKNLTKTANDISVALNIWQSIHSPVLKEHIIGEIPVPMPSLVDINERNLEMNDVYYDRKIPRNYRLSIHMLNFHNQGIKSMLYSSSIIDDDDEEDTKNKKQTKNRMLLELACGQAGDLPRWIDNGFDFILGIDLVKNNIVAANNGSYARFLKERMNFNKQYRNQGVYFPKAIFLIGDCELSLETGEAAKSKEKGLENDSELLLNLLYNKKNSSKYNSTTLKVSGKTRINRDENGTNGQFDMVSCQFAIHYFFKNEKTLNNFFTNVSNNLKENGLFICTFMDGTKVHKLISKTGKAEGKIGTGESIVWVIHKNYNTFTSKDPYAKYIDVYLENTNKLIPEYLVHFDELIKKAREFKLELYDSSSFEDTFKNLYDKIDKNDSSRNKSMDVDIKALNDDEVQKQFSFLNMWAIFRKMTQEEIREDDEKTNKLKKKK